ncbi:interleukin-7 isoform X5 [Ahaetulla prasina]|uniref:interleukin-7 isoform X5 n=1 Tax=Ahaetulla prasina TaxID=499056 RepID=UPI002648A765|nr:interleukin-7 isoform X5 [Ahaetulla prasina]
MIRILYCKASLRCIFMILPLFLVLVPEASSDNMTEIRNDYENILINMINHLNTTIIGLTSCLKIKANCTKIFPELKNKMISVSELTTKILNKNGYTLQPLNHSQCYRQCRKYIRKCDSTDTLCCLKNAVAALRSWWQKFLYHGYS